MSPVTQEEKYAKHRAWVLANPDKVKARRAEYTKRPEVRERMAANARNAYARHREARIAYAKEKRQTPEYKEYIRQYEEKRKNNPKRKEQQAAGALKRRYGITVQEKARLLHQNQGRCWICDTDDYGKRGPMVDHDHAPGGKVRGILCKRCNLLLGHVQDNPAILEKAIGYLRERQ